LDYDGWMIGRCGGSTGVRRAANGALTGAGAYLILVSAYLLGVLLGAARARRTADAIVAAAPSSRFLILVPAHDEEALIGDTLRAVAEMEGPAAAREVVVVADHCGDRTAQVAASMGAKVLERVDGARGKGAALRWALDRLGDLDRSTIVVVLDADCAPSRNLLTAIDRRVRAGANVVQADYVVANPGASPASAVRHAAFLLMNTVRPMGKDALGLSAGLRGTGMAFTADVLARRGWDTSTLVEDHEQHCALVAAGERVVFAADAHVSSPMPTSFEGSLEQQLRWDSGRWRLLRRWAPRLLAGALRHRDVVRADTAVDMLIPPQSLLLAGNLAVALGALAVRARLALRFALAALGGQVLFVLGGLRLAGPPAATYRGLLAAPLAVWQKLVIVGRIARGAAPREFVRTPREPQDEVHRDADAVAR
jgi:hypothetical protein